MHILGSARRDLAAGFRFYQRQAPGLGGYFLDSLSSDIDSLLISAGVHAKAFRRYHRLLSKRFPYAIYYRMQGQEVRVVAVFHSRRDPAWIDNQLKRRT
ncbi:type II toxin-antitoxin system RelE/ParE family toxin [Thiohalocapsa marina]|uniref:Type II toxin-antitoxin system RelE/ParE family toxin n=1 Tax=Thiohalocapsa marina TaxID=424902 RepID=A0A5M8FN01_9GAMM|nr:type II toxin-antitoxin system RelE/ParE family toxin [Thiohalocapsa marina]